MIMNKKTTKKRAGQLCYRHTYMDKREMALVAIHTALELRVHTPELLPWENPQGAGRGRLKNSK